MSAENQLLRTCTSLLKQTAAQVTDSQTDWTAFLAMAGRLYKYSFPEQIMIYAQRPDAVACADMETWNRRMVRYIRSTSSAIALLDVSGDTPAVRYVFDISDTRSGANARYPWLWQYQEREHESAVMNALENSFGHSTEDDLATRLDEIAEQLALEYWGDHKEEILEAAEGSFLEEYDELNVETVFRRAVSVSSAYAMMSRCNLEPDEYFQHRDFENVFEFNTPATIAALGDAVNRSTRRVLREMEKTIRQYELAKRAERSAAHGKSPELHAGGRLSGTQSDSGGSAVQSAGQIRPAAQRFSPGTRLLFRK